MPSAIRLLPPANQRASLAIDGPAAATFNTVVESWRDGSYGNGITLALAAGGTWVPNIGTLTLTGTLAPLDTETVTIGTKVYTFQTVLTNVDGNVLIGANASDSIDNLIAAINLGAGAGTTYATATTIHPQCRAFAGAGDTMVVHTKSDTILTAVGTLIATTETLSTGSWGATTLADGTDGTNVDFSVSGTAISVVFSSGYTTVSDFETALAADAETYALIRVKTPGTTPLYQLVVADDDFSATALTGGGSTSSAAPTLTDGTAGVAIPPMACDQVLLLLRSVAGSGTLTATGTLWGWNPATNYWYVLGAINGGAALAEVATDKLAYTELVVGLRKISRLHFQIGSLGGTGTEVEVFADCIAASAVSA